MSQNASHTQRAARLSADYAVTVLTPVASRSLSDRLASHDSARPKAHRTASVRTDAGSVAARAADRPRMAVASAVERSVPGVTAEQDADEEVVEVFTDAMFSPLSELPRLVKPDPVRPPMFQATRGGKLSFAQMWTQAVSNWHGSNRTSARRAHRAEDMRSIGEVNRSRP